MDTTDQKVENKWPQNGQPSPPQKKTICNASPIPKAQDTSWKRDGKIIIAEKQDSCNFTVYRDITRKLHHNISIIWFPEKDLNNDTS